MIINQHVYGGGFVSDANTLLLLHGEGANGSTVFTDSSSYARSVSIGGGSPVISTAQARYGGSSIAFDGAGSWLSVPDSAELDFGSSNFAIELALRFNTLAVTQNIIGKRVGSGYGAFSVIFNHVDQSIQARFDDNSADFAWGLELIEAGGPVLVNTWHRLKVRRSGTTWDLLIDDVVVDTQTSSIVLEANAEPIAIGASTTGAAGFNGYIDALRISDIAR